jgi:general secretion pathway protein L
VLARDAATRQLRVELVVLPLARLQALLERLGPLSAGLAGVDVLGADGQPLGVNLLPRGERVARVERTRTLNLALGLATVLLVLFSLVLVLGNRQDAHAAWNERVAAAQKEAREARKLRNALESSVRAANFLARQRARQPTVLEVLADLTRRLPDDTWLEKVAINGGNVVLIGQSDQAATLPKLLQDSTLLHKPTLTGSVQADPRTGKERFT